MATTLTVKNIEGADTDAKVDIQESWLEYTKGEQAVKDSTVAFLARMRSGSASTKSRGHIQASGAKPWRQKGNGRARAGNANSPIWRGGGVAFGPHPRSYAKQINRKVEKLALRRAFTDRLTDGNVILVENFDFNEPKTKEALKFLTAIGAGTHTLILVDDYDEKSYLASRNLPDVLVLKASSVNPYWMLFFKKIVITNAGLKKLGERLA
ncbi:MAG: 50S ribosomal protein L4 [Lentisphaeria bacterium]